jgi:hypothetical protein
MTVHFLNNLDPSRPHADWSTTVCQEVGSCGGPVNAFGLPDDLTRLGLIIA